jgi:Zn-finger protein
MRGGRIVIANRFFPSTQACSCCGCLTGPKGREGLGRENWVCSECSAAHTRDGNAAINLRKLGLAEAEVTRGAGKALRQRRRVGRRRSARRPFTPDGTYDDYFFGPSTGREAIKRLLAQFGDGGRNFRWELYDPVRCGSIGYASYRFSYGSTRAEAAGARVVFDGIGR